MILGLYSIIMSKMEVIFFDIAAIIIVSFEIVAIYLRKMTYGRNSRLFLFLLICVLVSSIMDFVSLYFSNFVSITSSTIIICAMADYLYFIFRNITPLIYLLYIVSVTDTWHILQNRKWLKLFFLLPVCVSMALIFTNPLSHGLFYYDTRFVYHRGPFINILYCISAIYSLYGVIWLHVFRRMLKLEQVFVLASLYPFNIFALIVQYYYPHYLIEMFMTSLSMLLAMLVIQRPEEMINPELLVGNYLGFNKDVKSAFELNKRFKLIFVKIVNYKSLSSFLEYTTTRMLLRTLCDSLKRIKTNGLNIYYLGNGLFSLNTDENDELLIASRVSDIVREKFMVKQYGLSLNCCICVIRCPEDIENVQGLLNFSNYFYTYLPDNGEIVELSMEKDNRTFMLRNDIDAIITEAIVHRSFMMYYQPIYSIKDKRFVSCEALIRLNDEKYGFISPEFLIKSAERNGLIMDVGDIVFDEVCSFINRLKKSGVSLDFVEINLSMAQIIQKDLVDKVLSCLNKYHLRPEDINLEITETMACAAENIVEQNMRVLNKSGISFSLDDYGVGYSNISRILSLPFDIVKIDKSLTDMFDDEKMNGVIKHTVAMLKSIGVKIVVEGVETVECFEAFEKLGVDYIQGYYFSKPLPESEFVEFIMKKGSGV